MSLNQWDNLRAEILRHVPSLNDATRIVDLVNSLHSQQLPTTPQAARSIPPAISDAVGLPTDVDAELVELRKFAYAVKAVVSAKQDMLEVHPYQFWMMHYSLGQEVDRLEATYRKLFVDGQG